MKNSKIPMKEEFMVSVPKVLTQKELSKWLCVSESYIKRRRLNGTGPKFIKLNRQVRYKLDDVLVWIESLSSEVVHNEK